MPKMSCFGQVGLLKLKPVVELGKPVVKFGYEMRLDQFKSAVNPH